MTIEWADLNYWAILAGTVFYMAFGALYYSPLLFGKSVDQLNNANHGDARNPLVYVIAAVVAILSSFSVAILVQLAGADDFGSGLLIGLIVAIIIAILYLKNMAFGLVSRKAYGIAVGEHVISFIVLGILHGMWT